MHTPHVLPEISDAIIRQSPHLRNIRIRLCINIQILGDEDACMCVGQNEVLYHTCLGTGLWCEES